MTAQGDGPLCVLGIETGGSLCSVAVTRDGVLIEERTFLHGMHLSERLIDEIDAVLSAAKCDRNELSLIAVGIGPGSFTGVRIGVMSAKTLAAVLATPLCGIDALTAMAAEYTSLQGVAVLPLLPCRAGVRYGALYAVDASVPREITAPAALTIEAMAGAVPRERFGQLLLCGTEAAAMRDELAARLGGTAGPVSVGLVCAPRASQIARLAALRIAAGEPPDPVIDLLPLYIAPPPITLPKPK